MGRAAEEGLAVGEKEVAMDGDAIGTVEGERVGPTVGERMLGLIVGRDIKLLDGVADGCTGEVFGAADGRVDGFPDRL